jgi:hypothetical protein
MADIDRIYDILRTQGETLATIRQSQEDTREQLFGAAGRPGAIPHLQQVVAQHESRINFWRGAIAILSFMWTAAMAYGAVVLGKHR